MTKKVYRTAIYARLSRDDGDKAESNSIISQKLFCREYIEQHSELELVDTFADDGQSGVSFDRPEFRRMEQAIRDGKRSQGSNFESVFKAHETARWSYLAVRRILTAQVYIGDLVQGKTGTPNYKVRKLMKKDPSEWIVVEDAHEPLISHSDFSAVQTMLARDRRACGDPENAGLFSGFLFCGDCGQSMVRKTVPSAKKK